MSKCGKCQNKTNRSYDDLLCCAGICKSVYHINCVGIPLEMFHKMQNKDKWQCEECRNVNDLSVKEKTHADLRSYNKECETTMCNSNIESKLDILLKNQNDTKDLVYQLMSKINRLTEDNLSKDRTISELKEKIDFLYNQKQNGKQNLIKKDKIMETKKRERPAEHIIEDKRENITPKNTVSPRSYSEALNNESLKHSIKNTQDTNPKLHDDTSEEDTESVFTEVRRRRRIKSKVTIGKSTVKSSFKAAEPKLWLFLGRVAQGTKAEDIKNYLNEHIQNEEFEVQQIETRGVNACFRVGARRQLEERLYDEEFWPVGTVVKRYFFRRNETANFSNRQHLNRNNGNE